jgi:hypothetical protein
MTARLTAEEVAAFRVALYDEVYAFAAAWREYADALLLDLQRDAESTEAEAERLRNEVQTRVYDVFATVRGEAWRAHPERLPVAGFFSVSRATERALLEAGITTMADLQERLSAGTLGQVRGIGPATVSKISGQLKLARDCGLVA